MTSAARLENLGSSVTPPPPNWDGVQQGARLRFSLRDEAGKVVPDEAVACCGRRCARSRQRDATDQWVTIRVGDLGADLSGVVTCKSVWLCPVCAPKIAAERRRQIRRVMLSHIRAGGSVWMGTFTVKHSWGDDPKAMREAMTATYRRMINGKQYQKNCARLGMVGYVKSLEVTHGPNGWHPHIHVLFFFGAGRSMADIEGFGEWLFSRWAEKSEAAGYGGCDRKAFCFEKAECEVTAGEYVLKGALDFEVTHAHLKKAAGGHRSPMQILVDIRQYKRDRDKFLFRTYAVAFKGARQLTTSKGFFALYGEDDLTDDEALDRAQLQMRPVARLHAYGFAVIVRKGLLVEMLDVAMVGYFALMCWLVNQGVALYQIRPPPDEGGIYA